MGCPTVKIKTDNEQGFTIINESDFDKKNNSLFAEKETPKKKAKSKAKED